MISPRLSPSGLATPLADADVTAIVDYVTTGANDAAAPDAKKPPVQPYRFTGYRKFLDPDGYPAVVPLWGTWTAINLNTGEFAWRIPFGEYPELAEKGVATTGTENYGGPIVTAGGGRPAFLDQRRAVERSRLGRAVDRRAGDRVDPDSR